VRRHAAAGGQDALADVHAADVLRAGLSAHQHDFLATPGPGLGVAGVEDNPPRRRARTGRQAAAQEFTLGVRIKSRVQKLVELRRVDALDRLLPGD
jgi:hypothetical protein